MNKIQSLLASFLLATLFALPAFAQESFDIQNFHTEIQMHENGQITVVETIKAKFTEDRHGIFRDIQTEGISIDIQSITDGGGKSWNYEEELIGSGTRLKVGDADVYVNGDQTYKIQYNVDHAVRFFPDHGELYWNATGNAWPVPIHQATATVRLPESVIGNESLEFKCFTGASYSAAEDCIYEYGEEVNAVVFRANSSLPPKNGMTIVVGMPPNIFERPASIQVNTTPNDAEVYLNGDKQCEGDCLLDYLPAGRHELAVKAFGYYNSDIRVVDLKPSETIAETFELKEKSWLQMLFYLIIFLAFGVIAEPIYTFFKKGRDPRGRGVLVPQYDPPDKLSPAEMGTLVDEKVDIRDLTSTIVDLCVRGYLKIKVLPKSKGWIFKTDDHELIKIDKPKPGDRGLNAFEQLFVDKVFDGGSSRKISDLQNKFYTALPKLKEELFKSLTEKKYFPISPKKVRSKYMIKGIIFIVVGFILFGLEINLMGTGFSSVFFINGFLSLIFSNAMPQKTPKGVEAREHILGFKHYMEIAEKDRLKFQEKKHIFYELLPYAMTLKIADKWSKAFEGAFDQPPEWYEGHHGVFFPTRFTQSLNKVSSSIGTAFASHPSSSGGSSGFSGGFSGGGFGGGGGGSW